MSQQPPNTPRRTAEAARIARQLADNPDGPMLSELQRNEIDILVRALFLDPARTIQKIEMELSGFGGKNPLTIMGLIQENLNSYRVQAANQKVAFAAAVAAAKEPTGPPLRAGLRSAKDPKLRLAHAMGDLKEEAEDLKLAVSRAKEAQIGRAAASLKKAMDHIKRIITAMRENDEATPEEIQQYSQEAK